MSTPTDQESAGESKPQQTAEKRDYAWYDVLAILLASTGLVVFCLFLASRIAKQPFLEDLPVYFRTGFGKVFTFVTAGSGLVAIGRKGRNAFKIMLTVFGSALVIILIVMALVTWLKSIDKPNPRPGPTPIKADLSGSWDEKIEGKDSGYVMIKQVGSTVQAFHGAVTGTMYDRDILGEAERLFWEGAFNNGHVEGKIYLSAPLSQIATCPHLTRTNQPLPFSLDLDPDGKLVGMYTMQNVGRSSPDCFLISKRTTVTLTRDKNFDEEGNPKSK